MGGLKLFMVEHLARGEFVMLSLLFACLRPTEEGIRIQQWCRGSQQGLLGSLCPFRRGLGNKHICIKYALGSPTASKGIEE